MSDETYRGYVFTQQLALESAILTGHREMEELYCTCQKLQSMFLCLHQQFNAYQEHNPCAVCMNRSSYLAGVSLDNFRELIAKEGVSLTGLNSLDLGGLLRVSPLQSSASLEEFAEGVNLLLGL